MAKTKKRKKTKTTSCNMQINNAHCGSGFYGLGFIGSVVYYISTATGFWNGVLGVLKSLVWPAFLVHGLLKMLGI
jgi:hypothetical protein